MPRLQVAVSAAVVTSGRKPKAKERAAAKEAVHQAIHHRIPGSFGCTTFVFTKRRIFEKALLNAGCDTEVQLTAWDSQLHPIGVIVVHNIVVQDKAGLN